MLSGLQVSLTPVGGRAGQEFSLHLSPSAVDHVGATSQSENLSRRLLTRRLSSLRGVVSFFMLAGSLIRQDSDS